MPAMEHLQGQYVVLTVPDGDGWVMVVDRQKYTREVVAMFRPEHIELATEIADRLNIRALTKES